MITVNQILGNINTDSNLRKKYEYMLKNDLCEKVVITRMETEKLRMTEIKLEDILDKKHALYQLANQLNWEHLIKELGSRFSSMCLINGSRIK
jgi:hypothetical protein